MNEDRFGPNGAVMDGMSEEMRREYMKPHIGRREIASFAGLALLTAPFAAAVPWIARSAWYRSPDWAWPAMLIVALFGMFAPLIGRIWPERAALRHVVSGAGFGLLLALGFDALFQFLARADAAALLP